MWGKKSLAIIFIFISVLIFILPSCVQKIEQNSEVSFAQLLAQPAKYNDKTITVEGFYFQGFEIVALSDSLVAAQTYPDRMIPNTPLIWLEGGISVDLWGQLNRQTDTPSGYTEYYGKVKITGKFQTGKFGHLDQYYYQITILEIEVLPWLQTGNLQVLVVDSNNRPLWGAKVVSETEPDGQLKVTGITKDDGLVTFNNIKAGLYKFYVSRFDYINQEFEAIVSIGIDADITINLIRDPQSPPTT